jgi:exosortase
MDTLVTTVVAFVRSRPVLTDGARVLLFGILCELAVLGHLDTVRALAHLSRNDPSASHLLLIPLLSAALVAYRRKEIFSSVRMAWGSGFALIAAGAGVAAIARLYRPWPGAREELALQTGALVILLVGGFMLVFGPRAFARARFALAFLVFTIPAPPALLDAGTGLLVQGSIRTTAALFTITGTPFEQQGGVFALSGLSIEITSACSGIRSSIALVLTALLAGHLFLRGAARKALLMTAVLPVAVLKNGIRIVTLSLLANYVDPAVLSGRLHTEGGVVFFGLALALLVPVLLLLRQRGTFHAGLPRLTHSGEPAPSAAPSASFPQGTR